MYFISSFSFFVLIVTVPIVMANPVTSPTSSDLSDSEKIDLLLFRGMVGECIPSYLKFMDPRHSDGFLLRFLASNNFNLTKAKASLWEYFEWREMENLDHVWDGDYTDMDQRYPYDVKLFPDTNDGSPYGVVLYVSLGKWNISNVAASTDEEQQRFLRHASAKMMELANHQSLIKMNPSLTKPIRFHIFVNLMDYSLGMHGCSRCRTLQLELIRRVWVHWSEAVEDIYLINAPEFSQYVDNRITEFEKESGISVHVHEQS